MRATVSAVGTIAPVDHDRVLHMQAPFISTLGSPPQRHRGRATRPGATRILAEIGDVVPQVLARRFTPDGMPRARNSCPGSHPCRTRTTTHGPCTSRTPATTRRRPPRNAAAASINPTSVFGDAHRYRTRRKRSPRVRAFARLIFHMRFLQIAFGRNSVPAGASSAGLKACATVAASPPPSPAAPPAPPQVGRRGRGMASSSHNPASPSRRSESRRGRRRVPRRHRA